VRVPSRLVQDDDSHWYLIASTDYDRFFGWLDDVYNGEGGSKEDWKHFEAARINGYSDIELLDWRVV
jgi:hypothetical protein